MKRQSVPSLAGTDDRVSDQPAGSFPNRGPAGPLEELHELALEIADECEAGEWVPWGTLRKYRAAKNRLTK